MMDFKRFVHYALLMAVPAVALGFFGPLEKWRGPAYRDGNFDPDYAYLFNSLNILNGIPPGHRDHPGTTVQTWGGLTLRIKYPTESRAQITESVLKDPETAISSLSYSLSLLCAVIMALTGIIAAEAFGSVWAGLAFQLFPMVPPFYWEFLTRFTPDLLSMNLACLFLALCCRFYLKGPVVSVKQAGVLGLVFGAAVASKITAIPIILIPLYLLKKNRRELLALLGSGAISFLVCIGPILRKGAGYFLVWNYQLMIHSGNYGGGEAGLPTFSSWSSSALNLWHEVWMIPAAFVLGGGLLLITAVKRQKSHAKLGSLLGLSLGLLLVQLMIVAKHPAGRYLMPAFSAGSVVLAIGVKNLRQTWAGILACMILACFAFSLPLSRARDQKKITDRTTAQEMLQIETERHDCRRLIPIYSSSSKIYALFFGNNFARNYYAESLNRLYPDSVIYDVGQSRFLKFDLSASTPLQFGELLQGPACMQGCKANLLAMEQPAPLHAHLLYDGQGSDSLFSLEPSLGR